MPMPVAKKHEFRELSYQNTVDSRIKRPDACSDSQRGSSLIELLVTVSILGILMASSTSSLRGLHNPLRDGSQQTMGFFKQVRAKAISSTSAYVVSAASAVRIQTMRGSSCATATTLDPAMAIDLPNGATFTDTSWTTCFTPRGLAESNIVVTLRGDESGLTRDVEVFLGGAVRESR
jgi:prepilin-type N-terminal cleavage/methylation domain-containing protein